MTFTDKLPGVELQQHLVVSQVDGVPRQALLDVVPWASVLGLRAHRPLYPNRVGAWLGGPFAKTTRVAEKPDRLVADGFGAITVSVPGFTVAVYPPMARDEQPREVRRARLDRFPAEEPSLSNDLLRGVPTVFLNGELGLSTGKACAQAAHAVMALDLGAGPVPSVQVREVGVEFFKLLRTPDVVIQDSGRTEIEPGTVTALGFQCW